MAASIRAIVKQQPDTNIISVSGMDGTGAFIQCECP
jgi:ABC-type Fe2+-enterobactin transport system substrate-binding protein